MGTKRLLLYALIGGLMVWGATGCDDDPAAPAPDNSLTSCFNCHGDTPGSTTTSILAISTEYNLSKHATGVTFERKSGSCAGCHSYEGFVTRVQTGAFPTGTLGHSSPIDCWTCHAPHTTGTFGLRTSTAVTFIDGSGTFDYGPANLCANCHQSRVASPAVPAAATDSITINNRWGPHHGTQAQMLAGKSGFFTTTNPALNSPHTTLAEFVAEGCVHCHMSTPPSGGLAGGHSWNMIWDDHGTPTEFVEACTACHTSAENFDVNGAVTEIDALIATTQARLLGAGLIDAENLAVPGKRSQAQVKAIFNYLLVVEDRSHGVHNANYARALLNSALEFVPAPPPKVAMN